MKEITNVKEDIILVEDDTTETPTTPTAEPAKENEQKKKDKNVFAVTDSSTFNTMLRRVGYDPDTKKIKVDGMIINVIAKDHEDSSWVETDYEKCEYDLCINKIKRATNVLMFDFYHEVGHILLQRKQIETKGASEWIEPHTQKLINEGINKNDIITEMTCDGYAYAKMSYTGTLYNLLPKRTIPATKKRYPEYSDEAINAYVKRINEELSLRRQFLRYLTEIYKSVKHDRHFVLKDGIDPYEHLPEETRKFMALKQTARAYGLHATEVEKQEHEKNQYRRTSFHTAMDRMHIKYDIKDTFAKLCAKLDFAITTPDGAEISDEDIWTGNVETVSVNIKEYFTFKKYKYVSLKNKPDDWAKEYSKYYWKSDFGTYIHATDLYKDTKANTYFIAKPADYDDNPDKYEIVPPEFDIKPIFIKQKVDIPKSIKTIQTKYKSFVEDFMRSKLKELKWEVSVEKRNWIQTLIGDVALYVTSHEGVLPSVCEINRMLDEIKGVSSYETEFKSKTETLKSYNERMLESNSRRK